MRVPVAQRHRFGQICRASGLATGTADADNGVMSTTLEQLRVTVNGEPMALPRGTNLAALLAQLELDIRKVAVERNREIVPRSTYAGVMLEEADALEIVHFIGGG
jgi:thiamine biosynthesis protein ThiS